MAVRILRTRVGVEVLRLFGLDRASERVLGGDVGEGLSRVPNGRDDVEDGTVDLPGEATEHVEAGENLVERVGVGSLDEVLNLLV